jgi:hypothetical protein
MNSLKKLYDVTGQWMPVGVAIDYCTKKAVEEPKLEKMWNQLACEIKTEFALTECPPVEPTQDFFDGESYMDCYRRTEKQAEALHIAFVIFMSALAVSAIIISIVWLYSK